MRERLRSLRTATMMSVQSGLNGLLGQSAVPPVVEDRRQDRGIVYWTMTELGVTTLDVLETLMRWTVVMSSPVQFGHHGAIGQSAVRLVEVVSS